MTPQVQYCPPAAAHTLDVSEPIFKKQFNSPICAEMNAEGEMVSPYGVSFDDYSRMQTVKVRSATHRRKPIPAFANDPVAMRRLVVRFLEIRTQLPGSKKGPLPGTDAARLSRAQAALVADVPRLSALADDLCRRYVEMRAAGAPADAIQKMAEQIENVDTQIILAKDTAKIVVGCIYRSYSCHENSVAVGEALGLKPPAVRQLLFRLGKTWERMQAENAPPAPCGRLPKTSPVKLARAKARYERLTPEQREAIRRRVKVTGSAWFAEKMKDQAWRDARNAENAARKRAARRASGA